MALLKKSTPEEQAAKAEAKRKAEVEKQWQAFWASPAGQARQAFDSGDHVFQYSLDIINQQAIIVAMIGSTTSKRAQDPTAVLNTVCNEGWELVNRPLDRTQLWLDGPRSAPAGFDAWETVIRAEPVAAAMREGGGATALDRLRLRLRRLLRGPVPEVGSTPRDRRGFDA